MSAVESAAFVFAEFRDRNRILEQEVLCHACFEKSPARQQPLTEAEQQKGYAYRVQPYFGGHECYDCGAVPTYPPCAKCQKPQGQPHPYYPELCRDCGHTRANEEGLEEFRRQQKKGAA